MLPGSLRRDERRTDKAGDVLHIAAISNPINNLITEIIGTLVLVLGVLFIAKPGSSFGALDALPVGLLVLAIGLSLGGPTGYAINPARDLAPRIMHALLPLKNKGSSQWGYSWIPVVGPAIGALLAGLVFQLLIELKVDEAIAKFWCLASVQDNGDCSRSLVSRFNRAERNHIGDRLNGSSVA